MLFGYLLCCLVLASFSDAHPVNYRVLRARSPALQEAVSSAPLSRTLAPVEDRRTFDLQTLFEGNERFRESRNVTTTRTEMPGVMFVGCTDNRLSPGDVFQTPVGSTISHLNLANQFSKTDPSADAAVAYAVNTQHVQHIVVLGHYGCHSVHTAMSSQPMDSFMQRWLQPVADIFGRSKRPEIKKLIMARRWHDETGAANADSDAFRALVEENVKATVQKLKKESILSTAYNRRNKNPALQFKVFVHGLVLDEETGEVKDLGVSFGPPGQMIPQLPFKEIVGPTIHNSFGKFKPKAKKLDPTSTSSIVSGTPPALPME